MTDPIRFNDGQAYDRSMGVWSDLVGRQFLDWVDPAPGQRWADIGCGSGAFTALLATTCAPASIDAIDPAQSQIAFARNRAIGPASFHLGDAMALPFGSVSYDAAVMALVLFFVPEPERGVAEMRRIVRPGGTVCAYVWDIQGGGTPTQPFWSGLREHGTEPSLPPSAHVAPLAALAGLWAGAGLEAVETRVFTAQRRFDDFETYWDVTQDIATLRTTVADLPPDRAAALKEGLRAKIPADADSRVTLTAWANAVKGRVPE